MIVPQALLLLMLYFEPPGPMLDDHVKSISDGIRTHNGIALAAFACIAVDIGKVMRLTSWPGLLLAWAACAGMMGVVVHPNDEDGGRAHNLYAAVTFGSLLLLHSLLAFEQAGLGATATACGWMGFLAVIVTNTFGYGGLTGACELVVVGSLWAVWGQLDPT